MGQADPVCWNNSGMPFQTDAEMWNRELRNDDSAFFFDKLFQTRIDTLIPLPFTRVSVRSRWIGKR